MYSRILSAATFGVNAYIVEVESHLEPTNPKFFIVGLPEGAVKESFQRVFAAIKNSEFKFPRNRITVNLAPADIKKEGPAFDLAIALGMIFAGGTSTIEGTPERANEYIIAGELALDGRVRPIKGALSMALLARDKQFTGVILPRENAPEAAVVDDIQVIGIGTLAEAVGFLEDRLPLEPTCVDINEVFAQASHYDIDFSDVRGQESAKRAITIAAAGAHNIFRLWTNLASIEKIT